MDPLHNHEYEHGTTLHRWYNIRHRYFGWSNAVIPFALRWTVGELLLIVIYLVVNVAIIVPALLALRPAATDRSSSSIICNSNQKNCPQSYDDVRSASQTLGVIGTLDALLMLIPVTRNSLVLIIIGVSFETAIKWHRRAAYFTMLVLAMHFASGVWLYVLRGQTEMLWYTDPTAGYGDALLYGTVSYIFGFVSMCISMEWVRRRAYIFFYYAHIPMFLGFVIMGCVHESSVVGLLIVPVVLWFVDWMIRIRNKLHPVQLVSIKPLSSDVTEIVFTKWNFKYVAGQYIFISFSMLNRLHSHPFSIASSPHEPYLRVYVKANSNSTNRWSNQLYELAKQCESGVVPPPDMYVEGPYGSTIQYGLTSAKHNTLLIAGGIGITYIRSLLYDIVHQHAGQPNQVTVVWCARHASMLPILNEHKVNEFELVEVSLVGERRGVISGQHRLPPLYQLNQIADESTNLKVIVHVYITDRTITDSKLVELQLQYSHLQLRVGRPEMSSYITGDSDVTVCGSSELLKSTRLVYRMRRSVGCKFLYREDAFTM
jgi:NAD(P)H-flavin reductase